MNKILFILIGYESAEAESMKTAEDDSENP